MTHDTIFQPTCHIQLVISCVTGIKLMYIIQVLIKYHIDIVVYNFKKQLID